MTRFLTIAATLALTAAPALACPSLEDALREYRREYGESPVWMGESHSLENKGARVLLMTSRDGSWTILMVDRYGACIEEFGYGSQMLQQGEGA